MSKDWVEWHREYDRPNSSQARRLEVVQQCLQGALADLSSRDGEEVRLISICSGDGRDVLPVLAEEERSRHVRAVLVELDPLLAGRARSLAAELGLPAVRVHTGDAGLTDSYVEIAPAHVVLACGVFGNISTEDVERVINTLPALVTDGGIVIWTRGCPGGGDDPTQDIRGSLARQGFIELSFTAPTDAIFRVGMHRLANDSTRPLKPGSRMFTFV